MVPACDPAGGRGDLHQENDAGDAGDEVRQPERARAQPRGCRIETDAGENAPGHGGAGEGQLRTRRYPRHAASDRPCNPDGNEGDAGEDRRRAPPLSRRAE